MNESRRQKKVAHLIKTLIAERVYQTIPDSTGLVTVTRVDMSKDLKTAQVFISFFGNGDEEDVIRLLRSQAGSFRKAVASGSKLKYNPLLIFELDPLVVVSERIDELISRTKTNEK